MANEKFTWIELRKAVAQMVGTSDQATGVFLDALIEAVIKGLEQDKQVKIKGIGTFALKPMAARKSVNIATGKDFVIAGYNKLTFSPEASMKENVEKRIDVPKTEEVVKDIAQDPLKKLGEQATEIVDILADLGQAPVMPVAEEPVAEEPIAEEPVVEEKPKRTGSKKWIWWIVVVVILLGLGAAGWYYRDIIKQYLPTLPFEKKAEVITPIVTPEDTVLTPVDTLQADTTIVADSLLVDSIAVENADTIPAEPKVKKEVKTVKGKKVTGQKPVKEIPRKYTKFIATERVNSASRLTWIAKKYYGSKDLWVFIYEANHKTIKDPAHIRTGQLLKIPKLTPEQRDLNNPETRKLVDELTKEYLNQ
ncbi:MAG: HU family DNA-binding protein [Paludibacteraceae bacterium]|nr:HU family DNA-binding protein [Paludibacteraceae bacterium]